LIEPMLSERLTKTRCHFLSFKDSATVIPLAGKSREQGAPRRACYIDFAGA
jgi:hypothetical protein